jgi:outer membrane lipoprotein-sorting protein
MRRLLALVFALFFAIAVTACGVSERVDNARDAVNELEEAAEDAENLEARLEEARTATYTAEYEQTDSNGDTTTFTIAQDGSDEKVKAYFEDDSTLVVDDGKDITICSKPSPDSEDDTLSCYQSESAGDGSGVALYGGAGFFLAIASLSGLSALVELGGGSTTDFEETIAGEDADCTRFELPENQGAIESCVLRSIAIVGRYSSEQDEFVYELTDFSNEVDSKLFEVPENAEIS